ncbi:hypothetical protein [Chloroflexus sp. Y-396-1]|uniref:hypothetical protein n=1 Tax=Chloroflexus sp. Y-396-1 TaxID=867845 RepID=UPI001E61339A|nr:hypothetical protein [Chloroflexus sp. Y-396-1]
MADLKPSNNTGITLTSDEIDQEKVRKYLEQEEKPTRTLGRFWGTIVALIAVGMAGFYIYTAGTLPAPVQWQRGIYVMLTYILVLLLYPAVGKKSPLPALADQSGRTITATVAGHYLTARWTYDSRSCLNYYHGHCGGLLYSQLPVSATASRRL